MKRRKNSTANAQDVRTLAVATPSLRYRWYTSLRQTSLEARLVNGRVIYYENHKGRARAVAETTVRALFPTDCVIRDRPFLARDNKEFWVVLNRGRHTFKDEYKKLIK